jgi:hypothetical protein
MKVSDLEPLGKQAEGDAERLDSITPAAVRAVSHLAETFSGLDKRLIPSVADAMTKIPMTKIDAPAIAGIAFQEMQPVISTPQIASALSGVETTQMQSFAQAAASIEAAGAFKLVPNIEIPEVRFEPSVIEAVKAFNLPQLNEALSNIPTVPTVTVAPRSERPLRDAVALAEVEDVAEIIDEAMSSWETYSPAKRRLVVTDIAAAISAMLLLGGLLNGIGEYKAAGTAIACATALIRLYWRMTGKLD